MTDDRVILPVRSADRCTIGYITLAHYDGAPRIRCFHTMPMEPTAYIEDYETEAPQPMLCTDLRVECLRPRHHASLRDFYIPVSPEEEAALSKLAAYETVADKLAREDRERAERIQAEFDDPRSLRGTMARRQAERHLDDILRRQGLSATSRTRD